jgi:4-hydroxybenzoate polyprenyltransferase/phosphoserine phosphatase
MRVEWIRPEQSPLSSSDIAFDAVYGVCHAVIAATLRPAAAFLTAFEALVWPLRGSVTYRCRTNADGRTNAVSERPLVVDLDDTLVHTDLLIESLFAFLAANPLRLAQMVGWLLAGRTRLKAEIARQTPVDVARLPYNPYVLSLISETRALGGCVYLASASNERYVEAVANHLGVFDGWLASNDARNLSGKKKADMLVECFGEGGFDYVGNGRADLPVWAAAGRRIAAGAPRGVPAALKRLDPSSLFLDAPGGGVRDWLKLFRVHQWSKNALVFVPVLAAHLFTGAALASAAVAAIAFSFVASAVYIVNDLVDLNADRWHQSKKNRPLAAGTAPIKEALIFALAFLASAFALALFVSLPLTLVLLAYLATTTAYSFCLKRKMMVDIIILAFLYTLRVIAGAVAVGTILSEWILAFSMFIFTSLALLKRYVELTARLDSSLPDPSNRDYRKTDLGVLGALSAAAGFNAVTVFALYISSDTVNGLYRHPKALWFICPILLYWVGRALIMAERRLINDDPIAFVLRDRVSLLSFASIAFITIAAA